MHCDRCDGYCVVEPLSVPVYRCLNCGDRAESDRRYQRALLAILADPDQAEPIARAALGVKR